MSSPCAAAVQSGPLLTAHDWLQRAGYLLDDNNVDAARAALHLAAVLAPDDAAIYRGLSFGFRAAELHAEAVGAEMAALALEQHSALMLYNLATSYLMTHRPVLAEKWYRSALRVDPHLVEAHQNLASILELDGRKELAQHHRDQAYSRKNLFVDLPDNPKRSVLILCAAATGNVPFDYLLPRHHTKRIRWVVEYASDDQFKCLPEYDLVFNAIGDQDVTARTHDTVQRFLRQCDRPVFNTPPAVARTARELIPELFREIDHVVVPRMIRLRRSDKESLGRELLAGGIAPHLLLRPTGSHGGHDLRLIGSAAELGDADTETEIYASAYHDYRSEDGFYRKYRVIFVDRKPFPYHLAISSKWQVHYSSADMLSHQWKRDEEKCFLRDAASALGSKAWRALHRIGEKLNLDFCGIDFTLLPDGRILVFEANATMLVHLEEFHDCLAFKNPYVQRILEAFDAMLNRADNLTLQGGTYDR